MGGFLDPPGWLLNFKRDYTMTDYIWRRTYNYTGTNAAQIAATGHIIVEDRLNAEKQKNLPHNQLMISNLSTVCTLHIFLDSWIDLTKPDFIIFPSNVMFVGADEGRTFTHVMIRNSSAGDAVAANEVKYALETLKRVKIKEV